MPDPTACYTINVPLTRTDVWITHPEDMDPSVVPPVSAFELKINGVLQSIALVQWHGNHLLELQSQFAPLPAPPPKPSIQLTIFHRDYRSHYGIVQQPYGPLDLDPC